MQNESFILVRLKERDKKNPNTQAQKKNVLIFVCKEIFPNVNRIQIDSRSFQKSASVQFWMHALWCYSS